MKWMNKKYSRCTKVLDFLMKTISRIALGSASKNARTILEKVNLIDYFEAIVDGNDVIKGKARSRSIFNCCQCLTYKTRRLYCF